MDMRINNGWPRFNRSPSLGAAPATTNQYRRSPHHSLTAAPVRVIGRRRLSYRVILGISLLAIIGGCFRERSFPLHQGELRRIQSPPAAAASTRQWLEHAAAQLRPLLPRPNRPMLLTDQMTDCAGQPIDVYAYFHRNVKKLQGLFSNWWALQQTAQSIERGEAIDIAPAVWPGFQSVWIPVAPGVELHGFLGFSEKDGQPRDADCIVVVPGLFGDNGALRSRDVSVALRDSGFHVLSLEPRGHGQTEAKHPDIYYNYGVIETKDTLMVSEWLQDTYSHIRRTGMVGFCWGANQVLLASWFDGRPENDPNIEPDLAKVLGPPSPRRHYEAGVIAYSPVLRWEKFLDRMDTPKSVWTDLSPALFQESIKDHMTRKKFPEVSGSLHLSIAYDFAYSGITRYFSLRGAGYHSLRLLPYGGLPSGNKLESARIPVLIVHSVNDPLQTAQEVVDLIAETKNPNVAALILPGGGHIGFQAYARKHFYSLMINFFDPQTGAAAK